MVLSRVLVRLASGALAALMAAALAPAALAQGIILPRERDRFPTPTPPVTGVPLEIRSLAVETSIQGRVATTRVDQVFYNPSDRELEGTYLFPLPEGAAVEKFSMFVDGTEVQGELLDASKARGIYESIVRQRRDPALLEFVGTRLFRASIFPIPPRGEKRVKLSYSEMLSGDTGTATWRFPLANARHVPRPIGRASIVVAASSERRLSSVFSPTHRVDVSRKDDRRVVVSWEGTEVLPDQDLTLILQEPAGDLGFSFAAHRPAGDEGTFLLLVAPAVDFSERAIPRDVVFCLDTSGSMAGEKIEQARNAIRYGVRSLGPEDRFALVTFSTEPRRFRDGLVAADGPTKDAALAFIDGIQAVGGTCIDDALQASLGFVEGGDADRPAVVFFLTDGLPTIGEQDPKAILERARRRAAPRVRLFSFGVGYDVNTILLDRLAEELRGARDYVVPKEDIEQKVSALVAKTTHPVMTDVTVVVEGVAVRDLYPRRLPDLFRGSELSVLGRYGPGGKAVIRVRGKVRGAPKEFVNEVAFPEREEAAGYLGRLWATRRVGHLMDEIRLRGETAELKDEVVRLAKRYGILTPYTSYLVLENEEMLRRFGRAGGGSGEEDREFRRRLGELAGRGPAGEVPPDSRWSGDPSSPDTGGGGTPTPPDAGGPVAGGTAPPKADGKPAVDASLEAKKLKEAESTEKARDDRGGTREIDALVRRIDGKTFYLREGVWTDAEVAKDAARRKVIAFSEEYLALAAKDRVLAKAFALGKVVVRSGDVVYEVVDG
jgi:Ca-activated chloride channel family protein